MKNPERSTRLFDDFLDSVLWLRHDPDHGIGD